jgi:hypothetical protein
MNRRVATFLCLTFFCTIAVVPLLGKTHQFLLGKSANLCGVDLEPGHYKLKLSEDVAGIYKGKRLLLTARVRIEPLQKEIPYSCRCSEGILKEVRMDTQKLIFLELVDRP